MDQILQRQFDQFRIQDKNIQSLMKDLLTIDFHQRIDIKKCIDIINKMVLNQQQQNNK